MSTSIRNISVAIDGTKSSGFCIELDGTRWRLDNFMLSQSLLSPNTLSFSLHKEPDERINEVSFNVCGAIIGKEVLISLETESVEKESLRADTDSVADIEFAGVIIGASFKAIVDSLVAPLSVINALIVALCMKKQKEVAKTLTMLEDIWDEYQVYESDEIDYIDDSVKIHYAKLEDE